MIPTQLGNWKFWVAVVVVVIALRFAERQFPQIAGVTNIGGN